jgi:ABC-2 type transport system permease protein
MPQWLQPIARWQPLTFMVNAVRGLTQGHVAAAVIGHSTAYEIVGALLWCGVIMAVFVPLAVMKYQKG